jgi:hypothetical protein
MDIRNFRDKSEDVMTNVILRVEDRTRSRYLRCLINYEIEQYRLCLWKRALLEVATSTR